MILFCMGLALGQFPRYRRVVEPAQKSAALKLLDALHDHNTGSSQEQKQQAALQRFLLTLFTQNKHDASRYAFTVFRFLILYSFRREGCLAKSSIVTQYISRIVFFGRGAIFNKIKKSMKKENSGYYSCVISSCHAASSLSPCF